MPEEPVRIETDDKGTMEDVNAYLVEARSRGGHSGSPAFLFYPMVGPTFINPTPPAPLLLGMVQGHFESSTDLALPGDIGLPRRENAGMAVVIPAQDIADLLLQR